MPHPDERMMMQQSITDNNDVAGRRVDSRYVTRSRGGGEDTTARVRDSSARGSVPRTIGGKSQGMARPKEEEAMRRVTHERVATQAVQVAQSLTLQHYKKTSKEGPQALDVSMHTYFPVAQGSQSTSSHSHDQTRRPRPPTMIGSETEESQRDQQRRQKERTSRPQPTTSRNVTSRGEQGSHGSSLQRRLEIDASENERRMREKGPSSGMIMKSLESNKSSISKGSAGSRGDRSRGSRSSSVPRQGDGKYENQESERPRRPRSSSVSIKASSPRPPPKLGPELRPATTRGPSSRKSIEQTASTTRMPRSSGGAPSRQSVEQERSYSSRTHRNSHGDLAELDDRPALRRIEESSRQSVEPERSYSSRTHRNSHGDLAELDDRPALRRIDESSRQSVEHERSYSSRTHRNSHGDLAELDDRPALRRIDESSRTRVDEDEDGKLRRKRQIMMKSTNEHRSQRSLESARTLDSHLHREPSDDRLRRKMSVESYDRPRQKMSDADSIDHPRRKSSIAEPSPRLRRKNSTSESVDVPRRRTSESDSQNRSNRKTGDLDSHDRLRNKSIDGEFYRVSGRRETMNERSSRARRGLAGDDSFSVDTLFESRNSGNPFADAMKAILLDSQSPHGFNTEKEMEQRIADLVLGKLKKASLRSDTEGDVPQNSNAAFAFTAAPSNSSNSPPQNSATIVLTDVQGSTSLWEANPQAMQEALDIHDKILRRYCAFHNGYEIDTEGDAFFLAFHNPVDAFGFALATQSALFDTEWSKEILAIPAAKEEGSFKGLRVRMGIHHGSVTSCKNEVTGRTEYVGEAMNICKCVEGMTHGGQILTTFETWNIASYKAEADLGSPQVVDLGCHLLNPKGSDEPVARRIIQLVPASLSYDYFAARRLTDDETDTTRTPVTIGRRFDPPLSDEQISASFNDAPHENKQVTIAFVYFSEIENNFEDPKPVVATLIRLIGDLLVGTPGYHSQSNMLAFPNVNEAVKFGLRLLDEVKETQMGDSIVDLSGMIKMGCVHDTFLTMGPHKTTGRADYFGKVVNRAARITAKSELGTVNFGVLADESVANLPPLEKSIICELKGIKQLKGVPEEMALYECKMEIRRIQLGMRR